MNGGGSIPGANASSGATGIDSKRVLLLFVLLLVAYTWNVPFLKPADEAE